MKFLLCAVNAKYIHSNPAVYSLRACAGDELRPHVEIAEYTINQYREEILADIYCRKPDVVGFSCYIWNWTPVQELLCDLPKVLPGVDIWLGGPEVTYDAPDILQKYPQVKGVMIGEGEETFRELLQYYAERVGKADSKAVALSGSPDERELSCIAGLCLPQGYTKPRPLTDMSALPFLYGALDECPADVRESDGPESDSARMPELDNNSKTADSLDLFRNRIIYYESSRGCPYRCSYCLSSIERKVRLRDISVIKKELQFFLDQKVPQVKFIDRTFNCNHEHTMSVWRYILENDNGVTNFHFEISADILREEEIGLLKQMRPGLVQLEIGVQSVNPKTLKAINRVMNVETLAKKVAAIREGHNVHQHLDLIAGLPYEDYESFGQSFNRVYGMRPQQLQLGFLKVLKGSEMSERAAEFGICCQSKPPYEVLHTNWLSYEDVLKLKRVEEMVELYYNSNQYTHTLPFLEKAFSTPFAMYEALAAYYEEKGYVIGSPARAHRYQVLLQFAQEADPKHSPIYQELLTFDLYLRENAKSRPEFAKDLTVYKEEIRRFYRREEEERRYLPAYAAYDSRQLARMTHLEPFAYPVWDEERMEKVRSEGFPAAAELAGMPEAAPQPVCQPHVARQYVLFDYQKRDALTYEAKVQIIDAGLS